MYRGSKNFKKILLTIKNQRINFIPITEGSTFSHCSGWKKFCSAYMLLDVYFSLRMEQPLIISGGRPAAQAVVSAAPAEMHWLAPAEEVRAVLARRGDLLATCPWQEFLRPSIGRSGTPLGACLGGGQLAPRTWTAPISLGWLSPYPEKKLRSTFSEIKTRIAPHMKVFALNFNEMRIYLHIDLLLLLLLHSFIEK